MYNYCLDSSVYGGRFGGGVSSLLLCAGESLQTMVFPQPVDKEKMEDQGRAIHQNLVNWKSREKFQQTRRTWPDSVDPDEPGGVTWVVVSLHVHAALTGGPRRKKGGRWDIVRLHNGVISMFGIIAVQLKTQTAPSHTETTARQIICFVTSLRSDRSCFERRSHCLRKSRINAREPKHNRPTERSLRKKRVA